MASKNLNFVIALKFLTDGFKKEASRVKSHLYALQRNFLALASAVGVGSLGLSSFISRMIEVAKKTSQASIALQNVSGSMKAYAENQKWLIDLSRKYGVEINSLTMGFAKFKAAADISGMSLEDQQKIFESVSRATVAFGLSQEDQKGVFMALSQMMSKNKVMAEELRLQLAERMPVAIQAMAKAAGVTVNELDSLMKQGKVLSSEVLPKFAEALTEMTPNVNLDNLNKSLVDLSNTFQQLTENLGVEQMYKSMVDSATKMLQTLANNTKMITSLIKGGLIVGISKMLNSVVSLMYKTASAASASAVKAYDNVGRAKQRLAAAEMAHANAVQNAANIEGMTEKQKLAALKKVADAEKSLNNATESYIRAQSKLTREVRLRNLAAHYTGWKSFSFKIRASLVSLGTSLKALAASNAITLILSAVTTLSLKLWESVNAARELRKQIEGLGKVDISSEIKDLETFQAMLSSKDADVREGAIAKINELLGTQLESEEAINKAIQERKKYLEAEAKVRQADETIAFVRQQQKGKSEAEAKVRQAIKTIAFVGQQQKGKSEDDDEYSDLYSRAVRQRADALEDMARYAPRQTSSTEGSGSKRLPVIHLEIDPDDVAATEELLSDAIIGQEREMAERLKRNLAYGKSIAAEKRDTSGDWKLSADERTQADIDFLNEKTDRLIKWANETGADLGAEISKSMAEATNLEEALRLSEMSAAFEKTQKELANAKVDLFEGSLDNIEGLVDSFSRLNEAITENKSSWEVLTAMFDVFKTAITGVMETIELMTALKEANAAAQEQAAMRNVASSQAEALASGTASAAKSPFPLLAIGSVVAAILSVFSSIPKFANGGIVGGNSTQGDKVLARLNSGEGVLNAVGMQSLHDASIPTNTRNIRVTGVLVGQGRTLKAIIDKEDKFQRLTK